MQVRRGLVLVITLVALLASFATASAQITTGNISGSVNDAQGAVIPGATVVLISETRGTQLAIGRHQ